MRWRGVYRYRGNGGWGSGSFSVVRTASRRFRSSCGPHPPSRRKTDTMVSKRVSNRVARFACHETPLRPSSSGVSIHHRADLSTIVDKIWSFRRRAVRSHHGADLNTIVFKIWSRQSSCDSHRREEMSPIGDKTCLVSESFGSGSVASLRTPPTWFHRVRACAGENDFTRSAPPPIRPQRPPEHPPLLGHTHLPPNDR